jgi:hypothetical protein
MRYAFELVDEATKRFVRKLDTDIPFFESEMAFPIPLVGDEVISEDGTFQVTRRQFFYQLKSDVDGEPVATVHVIGKKIADDDE